MKNFIIFISLIVFSTTTHAELFGNEKFSLRAGLSFNRTEIRTDRFIDNGEVDDGVPEDETITFGFGVVTSVSYRYDDWEFGFASDILFGKIKDITFNYDQSSIRGGGHSRMVSIGPQLKYYTPYSLVNKARFYLGFGPAWSLQTFVFQSAAVTTGNFNNKRRISFENYGGGLFVGLEEILPSKEDHPMFLEVGYSYMHSYRVSVLNADDTAEVVTLNQGDSNDFSGQYLIIRAGFTLF